MRLVSTHYTLNYTIQRAFSGGGGSAVGCLYKRDLTPNECCVINIEYKQLCVLFKLSWVFSVRSDFYSTAAMTERVSFYEEKYLTEDEISVELLADTLLMFLTTLIVTVKMTVTLLLLEIGKTKLCILY
jgi:hypothetical protein